MKIGVFHSGDMKKVSPGGVTQYIEKLIKNKDDEDEIILFGTMDKKDDGELFKKSKRQIDGFEFTFVPVSKNDRKPLSIFYFINMFIMFFKHKEFYNSIDIAYAQRMEYVLPFLFICKKMKVAMAVHGSGRYAYIFWGNIVGFFYNMIERLAVKRANLVVVLLKREEFGVPYYKRRYTRYKDKIVFGKVPIDVNVFQKMNKDKVREKHSILKNEKVIAYFGRIEDNPKRVLLFPKIMKKLTKKIDNIKWIVIGSGNDLESLKKMVSDFKLEDYFIFKSYLQHGKELVELINCSDVSVISSSFEGICMSALESIACGVPVIATNVGDVNEYLRDGRNGCVLPNSSEDELVGLMSEKLEGILSGTVVIEMDDIYFQYEGKKVVEELKEKLKCVLGEHDYENIN